MAPTRNGDRRGSSASSLASSCGTQRCAQPSPATPIREMTVRSRSENGGGAAATPSVTRRLSPAFGVESQISTRGLSRQQFVDRQSLCGRVGDAPADLGRRPAQRRHGGADRLAHRGRREHAEHDGNAGADRDRKDGVATRQLTVHEDGDDQPDKGRRDRCERD
jgi:hypothetical protein